MIKNNLKSPTAILLMHCPDAKGIVADVTTFILKNNGNIVYLDQYVDRLKKVFFMRIEWELTDFSIPIEKFGEQFDRKIARKFKMKWRQYRSDDKPRIAVFVSKMPHCLYDILARHESGELEVDIPLIISNHLHLKSVADKFGIVFHHYEVTPENKSAVEQEQINLLKKNNISFVVLARYMQILSENFISEFRNKIINIHHSFLPAFPGAKPYHSAYERGVKIIGATSHYVTTELDAGPIIEQDVVRVTHSDSVPDFVRKGRDLEKVVLSRAIRAHLERKLLVYENRTIVFV